MKLGTDTASMTNYLMSGTKGQPEPEVGMGVTILHWTDRSAGTITKVVKDAKGSPVAFEMQVDNAVLVSGSCLSEAQGYRFEPNPLATPVWYRKDRKGQWRQIGVKWVGHRQVRGFLESRQSIRLGERDAYHDPSF